MEQKTDHGNKRIALRVSLTTILSNVFLAVLKLAAGIFAHSAAMLSDAVHSVADVFVTFIVIIGVKMSNKESDEGHPYGHERLESVAAILLSGVLFLTGVGIGYSGAQKILSGEYSVSAVPGVFALAAAVLSIVVKEVLFFYMRRTAKKIDSNVLMADAWHQRSDSLSSIGSLIGIAGARLGFAALDPAASVVICLFIIKAAYQIFRGAIKKMTDEALDSETIKSMRELTMMQEGVLGIDHFHSRVFGDKYYVDVEIQADGQLTLRESHHIAQSVHDALEAAFPKLKHCMVHVNPALLQGEEQEDEEQGAE